MEDLSKYILSVVAAAFVVGILNSIMAPKNSSGALFRLLGGLFMSFVIISPLVNMDFSVITDFWEEYALEAELASVSGEDLAEAEYRTIIKDELEAYILDKAKELGLTLTVEMTLGEDALPREVILQGAASPQGKSKLQQIIRDELGIAKENQLWIG